MGVLQELGAESVGDIPLDEWLEYVRGVCLEVLKDKESCEEMEWGESFLEAALSIDNAIIAIKKAYGN
jgi:hypothetical protein